MWTAATGEFKTVPYLLFIEGSDDGGEVHVGGVVVKGKCHVGSSRDGGRGGPVKFILSTPHHLVRQPLICTQVHSSPDVPHFLRDNAIRFITPFVFSPPPTALRTEHAYLTGSPFDLLKVVLPPIAALTGVLSIRAASVCEVAANAV